jgi:trimeric autotransporter adhesin
MEANAMEKQPKPAKKRLLLISASFILVLAAGLSIYLVLKPAGSPQPDPPVMAIKNLVLYYPFSGNAEDLSGNGINGEVHGAVPIVDRFGKKDRAYYFDGVDDSIIFDAAKLPNGSAPRTISAWIKADSYPAPAPQLPQIGSRATVIGWGKNDSLQLSCLEIVNQRLTYHVYNWDTMGKQEVGLNQWYHLVIVNSGQKTTLYINGTAEEYDSKVLSTANLRGRIGAFPDQSVKGALFPDGYDMSYFNGSLDDIRIYADALSPEQIGLLYHEGGWK